MKSFLKGAAAAAILAGVSAPALAQSVLTIDLDRVYAESAAGKSATTQMQARYNGPNGQANAAFTAARQAYETQVAAAQKLAPTGDVSKLPPATRQALGDAQEKLEDARQNALAVQQAIQQSAAYVRDQITQAVLPLAEQVRAEKKATAVALRGSLLAADPAADVTSIVLPRLDAKLTTVPIVPPQQQAPAPATPAPATGTRPNPQGR